MRKPVQASRGMITARDRELLAMPTLAKELPIGFTTTKATWTD